MNNTFQTTLSQATLSQATLYQPTLSQATLSQATLSQPTLSQATSNQDILFDAMPPIIHHIENYNSDLTRVVAELSLLKMESPKTDVNLSEEKHLIEVSSSVYPKSRIYKISKAARSGWQGLSQYTLLEETSSPLPKKRLWSECDQNE